MKASTCFGIEHARGGALRGRAMRRPGTPASAKPTVSAPDLSSARRERL